LPESALVDESEVSPIDIIPTFFSTLVYRMGDEEWEHWCSQFREVVSHDHHQEEIPKN
jgi:hypothetical protein